MAAITDERREVNTARPSFSRIMRATEEEEGGDERKKRTFYNPFPSINKIVWGWNKKGVRDDGEEIERSEEDIFYVTMTGFPT